MAASTISDLTLSFTGKSCLRNLEAPQLYEAAMRRGEAALARSGALVVRTGPHTGRSPKDKFIVADDATEDALWWDNNGRLSQARFDALLQDFIAHAAERELFTQDLFCGADPAFCVKTRIFTELAWHSLFIRNLLIRPAPHELHAFEPELTIVDLPSFRADPARHGCRSETVIALDLTRKLALIGGTSYAGEIKKSAFTFLNFMLPAKRAMPMHCSANIGASGDVAIFFGLSGTGKTTLSADPGRTLIGDDEHGWSSDGVFNFEGGCYAKAIRLSREAEPQIYAAAERFGSVMENVAVDPLTRICDFDSESLTENTRVAYPLSFIPNASVTGRGGHPKNLVMLTCDAFGVLPPIARLDADQAMYHFISGYTAKVAGAEKGVKEPEATFSACFGAPFMPRHPRIYGDLLRELISRHKVKCWLVNTGWSGGGYGAGSRMPINATRRLLAAALDGELDGAPFAIEPYFGLATPEAAPDVPPELLNPLAGWTSRADYDAAAKRLARMFKDNFAKFEPHVKASGRRAAAA
jgi:phosphoenolpyruvate carboxykinase (ATP)